MEIKIQLYNMTVCTLLYIVPENIFSFEDLTIIILIISLI